MKFFKMIKAALTDQDKSLKETEKNIKAIRATLNGEDGWFLRAKATNKGVKLECECREIEDDERVKNAS